MKGRLVDRDETVDTVGMAAAEQTPRQVLSLVIVVNMMETASHAEGVKPRSQGEQNTTHDCREQLDVDI